MNIFLTGCDDNTAWQLPWFLHNFRHKCEGEHLVLADFGLSDTSIYEHFDGTFKVDNDAKGWFKKPAAIREASEIKGVSKVCWVDTDCEIRKPLDGIFGLSQKEMLGMVQDRPWTVRRPQLGEWYNSGVVLVEGTPSILRSWEKECISNPTQGDQEVLHSLLKDPLSRLTHIESLPNRYNVLRLQHIDNTVPKNPLVYHWTGIKGKDHIRKLING